MKISNILWGICLVILGIIFGLNALEITNIDIFFDGWWTLFIIIPCFIDLFKSQDKTGNIIGLVVGIVLLLGAQDILRFDIIFKLLVPAILVAIGISVIFKDAINGKIKKEIENINNENKDVKEYYATFGEQNLDFASEDFKGADLNAIFGSVKCKLTDVNIIENVVVKASAIFGSVTIYVPDHVNVKINSTPIFGGISDQRKNKTSDADVTLYINALCVFGGIDIK